ncbi:MAG TPA: hypothetical protein VNM47_10515, partial [Terriglobia bacterium]|nr:hypothetical protein [Terriglobia bacterium]
LKDGLNILVCDKLRSLVDGFREFEIVHLYQYAAGEGSPGQFSDFPALAHSGLSGLIRLSGEFRMMDLKVQALQALNACHEPGF